MTNIDFTALPLNFNELQGIVEQLLNGKTILFPTDTIWGIGCDATNPDAIQRIYDIKQRTPDKPYVLLVSDMTMLKNYVEQVHPKIETLLNHHIRPLSVVYPKAKNLPARSIAQDGSVAIRIVQDLFCQALIKELGRPLVATSANISGQPFPGNFKSIDQKILNNVDHIIDYRQEEEQVNNPSVLVAINKKGDLEFLRK